MPHGHGELWDAADAKAADAFTMAQRAMPGAVLMERAALAVADRAQAMLCDATPGRVIVLCGPGNNGGDGLAVARLLMQRLGHERGVAVFLASERAHDGQLERARLAGVEQLEVLDGTEIPALVVDALLGTGATGSLRPGVAAAAAYANDSGTPVLSIDVPTGVCATTGMVQSGAVQASVTVTMQAAKPGLLTGRAFQSVGELVVARIGLEREEARAPWGHLVTGEWVTRTLARLAAAETPHKGARGHVGVLGGGPGTRGAAILAGRTALESGAGLCTVAFDDPQARERLMFSEPSLMTTDLSGEPMVEAATALVVGPGWTEMTPQHARTLWADARPAVWDASALRQLAALDDRVAPGGPRLLTPHPGEAGAMLGHESSTVQADRGVAARDLAERYGATVLLKGVGTIVDDGRERSLCAAGSGALATAGSGDTLAGLCATLLARGLAPFDAARVGAYIHGMAGELAGGPLPGVTASTLVSLVARAMRESLAGARSKRDPTRVEA